MLVLKNVVARYGSIEAIHGVSLEVGQGELIALIGANGAGKSTLLRTISGLVPTAGGTIEFEGQRIDRLSSSAIVRLGIAHCPEERKLWPDITLEDHLLLGAYVRRDRREIENDLRWIYEIFPMAAERRHQMGGTLSGGQQQMVAIGRALMLRPRLLMLDEPSLGLAPLVVEDVAAVIKKIHEQGTTILLVEQNAFLALKLADRAYVLESGNVAREGRGSDLLKDDYVQDAYLGGGALRRRAAKASVTKNDANERTASEGGGHDG